jgi:hypothetical protein
MYFVFADDAKQNNPTRERMGPLVSAGALLVDSRQLRGLETAIEKLCKQSEFPVENSSKSEFKWSPGPELWMRRNLVGDERERFFLSVIHCLTEADVKGIVAIDDKWFSVANCPENSSGTLTHEQDATFLLFERINRFLRELREDAIIINDRPSGDENKFLADALEMWRKGTRFVNFDRIAINLLCTQSRFVRLLQCADLVTSCVTAYVGGENIWSPRIFAAIRPLLHSKDGRIGGYGLKFHSPRHRNLYHWLLDDSTYHAGRTTYQLPFESSYDHRKPADWEGWKIYLELLKTVSERRPLILPMVECARPGLYANEVFELRFEKRQEVTCACLARPNNRRFLSEAISVIIGRQTKLECSVVRHF